MKYIVMDSTPPGLLAQRPDAVEADACRQWLEAKTAQGMQAVVPEIVDYEVRRELIRCEKVDSVMRLDLFVTHPTVLYLPITTVAIRLAAEMWANARKKGKPTADPHALDVDVILAAQALSAGFTPGDFVVATSNVSHLSRFVAAEAWPAI